MDKHTFFRRNDENLAPVEFHVNVLNHLKNAKRVKHSDIVGFFLSDSLKSNVLPSK
ncbi:hypothetical protein [Helicobacter sp. MIT 05-5294]|uniref:hypothetical protein n=1 Tax=Helicobacter sp. MIT 05-5294 TaxID=1548150 RepID=UPI000A7792A3|nr:hypothetical protein [Helicobacter sp. MIT 05-5294]